MFQSCEQVARRCQSEHNGNHKQRCGQNDQAEVLYGGHQQVEAATRPILVKIANKVGESVCQWADLQQKRNLHEYHHKPLHDTNDGEDYHKIEVKDVGNSQCKAKEDV